MIISSLYRIGIIKVHLEYGYGSTRISHAPYFVSFPLVFFPRNHSDTKKTPKQSHTTQGCERRVPIQRFHYAILGLTLPFSITKSCLLNPNAKKTQNTHSTTHQMRDPWCFATRSPLPNEEPNGKGFSEKRRISFGKGRDVVRNK